MKCPPWKKGGKGREASPGGFLPAQAIPQPIPQRYRECNAGWPRPSSGHATPLPSKPRLPEQRNVQLRALVPMATRSGGPPVTMATPAPSLLAGSLPALPCLRPGPAEMLPGGRGGGGGGGGPGAGGAGPTPPSSLSGCGAAIRGWGERGRGEAGEEQLQGLRSPRPHHRDGNRNRKPGRTGKRGGGTACWASLPVTAAILNAEWATL